MNNLPLYVGKDDCIRNMQKKFSEIFPHLWIELFSHSDVLNNLSMLDILYTRETKIADINPVLEGGKLEIDTHMTVLALESAFYNQFGLFVQVSRTNGLIDSGKSGISHFTLDEANQKFTVELPMRAETILFRDVPYGC